MRALTHTVHPERSGCAAAAESKGRAAERTDAAPLPPGSGTLRVARAGGLSAVVSCAAASPLHLFTPRPRGEAVWAVATTHGGGLVAGDAIDLEVEVGPGATALLSTQSNTRVYRSTGATATQRLVARVAEGAALAVLPEPTTPFAGARLAASQRFVLAAGASLLLVDALSEGRGARGERWAFTACASRNEIEVAGRPVLADAVRLVAGEGPSPAARMGEFALLATVVALGPAMAAGAARILAEHASAPVHPQSPVLAAASPLADGVHLRLAARSVAAGMAHVRAHLAFAAALLGVAPFDRRP
ncbi:MAG: urease accessory protein UreD [Anaeromyxobacteraceae bacterium]